MTPQLIPLLLSPILLAIDLCAVVIGFRGVTRLHKLARVFGVIGICLFIGTLLTMIDVATQVWVAQAGSMSARLYVAGWIAFFFCTVASLVLSVKACRGKGAGSTFR
ncbi:hypothetical protein [Lysobacter panacisoli]|uniref:Uncharacterized protein n=1 Tax=Lysobacter panacisoli TaxID=1255263 RepID=A0ABP9LKE8_9GAMM|nr:hypothetical protein [Lysobacter panacisoli]